MADQRGSRMKTLLIADDERTIREGIAGSIDWNSLGISRVLLAANGREAYKTIKRERPDIVIIDIVMPEMTGIEVISRFQDDYEAPEFVIISGYSEFDYAQEAIRYNVKDYILKPCDCNEIANTVRGIVARIERRRSAEREQMHLRQYVDSLKAQAQEQAMRDLLIGAATMDAESFVRTFDTVCGEYQLLVFSFEDPGDYSQLAALKSCIDSITGIPCWRFSLVLGDCVVLVLDAEAKVCVKSIVRKVYEKTARSSISGIRAAVSAAGSVDGFRSMYRQAWEAVRLVSPCGVSATEAESGIPLMDASASRYSEPVRQTIQYVKDHLSDSSLSLNRISSDVLYLNPDYLGRLFKKECGIKFSDYLTTARMERAKRIIATSSELRIYEVARLVGFGNNTAYFGHLFRQYTGMRPTEYRARFVRSKRAEVRSAESESAGFGSAGFGSAERAFAVSSAAGATPARAHRAHSGTS